MSDFSFSQDSIIDDAVDFALQDMVLFLQQKIKEITPRDKNRLPQNINRKDGKAPHRSKRPPVRIWGNWYPWVTGNLKRSISHEKITNFFFMIGVQKWPTTKYAAAQEFGTIHIPPRSFIRKWIFDNLDPAKRVFQKSFQEFFKK